MMDSAITRSPGAQPNWEEPFSKQWGLTMGQSQGPGRWLPALSLEDKLRLEAERIKSRIK